MDILNKLTIKHLTMNKKRTIVTIIGVILSTALMVGIGLLLSTVRENTIQDIKRSKGDYHAKFEGVPYNKLSLVEQNNTVSKTFVMSTVGYAKLEGIQNLAKPYLKVVSGDDRFLSQLQLLSGRLPENSDEVVISKHISTNGGVDIKLGDTLSLEIGDRFFEGAIETSDYFIEGETIQVHTTKEYKVVGIVSRSNFEPFSDPGYSIFTTDATGANDKATIYVQYKKIKKTYDNSSALAQNLGIDVDTQVTYNDTLLAMSGVSNYSNLISGMSTLLIIILGLVSIGCIIVIYNSFAISVMERKKQFGLFSSIGATKRQLRKTVFFEAIIVGVIGIPLGILGSYLGIGIVLWIINALLPNMFSFPLVLSTYPTFIMIPIVFMIVTILASAFIPARQASRITPIEAIRQNDDIKIKRRRLKSNRIIKKVFGIEGEIAHKNMLRNKKKYRITIASLVVSIVLFISFSAFMTYTLSGMDSYLGVLDYDMVISNSDILKDKNVLDEIAHHEQVEDYRYISHISTIYTNSEYQNYFTKEMKEHFDVNAVYPDLNVLVMPDDQFKEYLEENNFKESKPIIFNRYVGYHYTNNSRKSFDAKRFSTNNFTLNLCDITYKEPVSLGDNGKPVYDCFAELNDFYLSDKEYVGSSDVMYSGMIFILVSQSDVTKYFKRDLLETLPVISLYLKADKYDALDKLIKQKDKNNEFSGSYMNVAEEMKMINNMSLVAKILVYGFISLVTLIGVTSVFNTINTSIALRRKEFAMLRSMGLTPKGFNKMLRFESLFVGLKALFIGIPLALGVTVFIYLAFNNMTISSFIFPWQSILIAAIGVFLIVLLTMTYASRKIKRENILEAIREENI